MSAHGKATPTPWTCSFSQPGIWHVDELSHPHHGFLATCYGADESDPTVEANARLIVAAVNNFAPLREALAALLDNPTDPAAQTRAAALLAQIDGGEHG